MSDNQCQICFEGELHREVRDVDYKFRGCTITVKQSGDWCDSCGEGILNGEDLKSTSKGIELFKKTVKEESARPLKEMRIKLNLTQKEASLICGGGVNTFFRYERGEMEPSKATLNLMKILSKHPQLLKEVKSL